MSSNDFLLLERPSIVEVSRGIAAGDTRASLGAKYNMDRWFVSGYLTGNSWGNSSSASRTRSQIGAVARVAGRPVASADWDLHLGFSGSYVPEILDTNNGQTLRLRDFPEVRLELAADDRHRQHCRRPGLDLGPRARPALRQLPGAG